MHSYNTHRAIYIIRTILYVTCICVCACHTCMHAQMHTYICIYEKLKVKALLMASELLRVQVDVFVTPRPGSVSSHCLCGDTHCCAGDTRHKSEKSPCPQGAYIQMEITLHLGLSHSYCFCRRGCFAMETVLKSGAGLTAV